MSDCRLWSAVRERIGWTSPIAEDVHRLFRGVDGHSAMGSRRGDLAAYGLCNRKVLDAIRSETGARVIIDGSKYAARALALQQVMPIRVICLTRSLRGLNRAWSRRVDPVEQPPKSKAQVLAYWSFVRSSLAYAGSRLGEVLPIRYASLATDPAAR